MAIAKRTGGGGGSVGTDAVKECVIGKQFSTLLSFVADTTYADGEVRTPGSITIFKAQDGGLRLCLNDKNTEESAFISGNSLTELFEDAEQGLLFQALDWRTQKKWKGKK